MTPRRVVDDAGAAWELWEVAPAQVQLWETHAASVRLSDAGEAAPFTPVPGELRGGWLAARNGTERRRIVPVPTDWLFMTDGQLRQLIARAVPRPASDRRSPTDAVIHASPAHGRVQLRSFADAAGQRWDVWEAHPMLRERREARDRRATPRPEPDRRSLAQPGYGSGWLVFRNGAVRHRLYAIPAGWHELGDADLRLLLVDAARRAAERR